MRGMGTRGGLLRGILVLAAAAAAAAARSTPQGGARGPGPGWMRLRGGGGEVRAGGGGRQRERCVAEAAQEVAQANFKAWNDALKTRDSAKVASLYCHKQLSFLPTVSPKFIKDGRDAEAYFAEFVKKLPDGTITADDVQPYGPDAYLHTGMYTFMTGPDTDRQPVEARFSYMWRRIEGAWKIVHHHSSALPKAHGAAQEEARGGMEAGPGARVGEGEVGEAMGKFEEALGIRRRVFGDEHVKVAETLYSLGLCKEEAGEVGRAVECFREAQGIFARRGARGCTAEGVAAALGRLGGGA